MGAPESNHICQSVRSPANANTSNMMDRPIKMPAMKLPASRTLAVEILIIRFANCELAYFLSETAMPFRSSASSSPICLPLTFSSTPFEFLSSKTFTPPATATPACPAE